MRLIDADALKLDIMCVYGCNPQYINWLNHAPTVEAVPVVRCKDCKFSKPYYHGPESNLGMFTYLCTQGLYGMNADDYCSRAERRKDDRRQNNTV